MTKEEIIGQALLKISGGEPNDETSVWISELESYLPAAVNKVMLGSYDVNKKQSTLSGINPLFLQVYDNIPVTFDSVKKRHFITLSKPVVSFPDTDGLQYVGTVSGKPFNKFNPDNGTIAAFYWKINDEVTSYSIEGQKVYLYNHKTLNTPLMVKQVVHVSSLNDTDEVLLPSGQEIEVIDLLVKFFSEQRAIPKDTLIDGGDKV